MPDATPPSEPDAVAASSPGSTAPLPSPSAIKRAIPNALTLARLALAVLVFWLLASIPVDAFTAFNPQRDSATQALVLAAVVFVIAAVTDAADGYLARRWHTVSPFGRVMDPFADKILVLGTAALLVAPTFLIRPQGAPLGSSPEEIAADPGTPYMLLAFEPWMVVVLLARELLVTSLRGVYEARGVSFPSSPSGKVKMVLQSVGLPAAMIVAAVTDPEPGTGARSVLLVIAWCTTLVTAWSGVPYILAAAAHERRIKRLASASPAEPEPTSETTA